MRRVVMSGRCCCLPFAAGCDPDDIVHDLRLLEAMLQDCRAWLEAEVPVDARTATLTKVIRKWAWDVEAVLDEWKLVRRRAVVEPPPPPRRFGRRRYARDPVADFLLDRDFRRRVSELKQRREEIPDPCLPVRNRAERQFPFPLPECADPAVGGRDEDREILATFLLERAIHEETPLSVVAVLGPAGVGKTTLARQLCLDPMVRRHFDLTAWVCAAGGRLIPKLMEAMAGGLTGVSRNSHNQYSGEAVVVLQELLERGIAGKRLLLVVDDVCYDETIAGGQWEEMLATFRRCGRGSVIILTTQEERVAQRTQTVDEPYFLEPLPGDLSWSVFRKHAFSRSPSPDNPLVEPGKKIAKDCHGFPLFARALGHRLRRESNVEAWRYVASRGGMWDDVLPILRWSYNRLPTHLKRCFVYCSMFPRGYLFSREELVQLWMAQGFLGEEEEEEEGGRSLEDVGIECFDDLCLMSYFQQSELDAGAFVLPNPLHALARSISDGECIAIEKRRQWDVAGSDLQKARHLSLAPSEGEFASNLLSIARFATHLLSFVMIPTWPREDVTRISLPDAAFHSLNRLRVLDLRYTDLEALPSAIGSFQHLRYLNLSGTKIKHVNASFFKQLYNLQTLDLSSTEIRELPDTIGNMRYLLHLHLNVTMITQLPESIGKLSKLRTLQLVLTKIEEMPETVLVGLQGLRFLCLDVSRIRRGVLDATCWMSNLQSLELQGTDHNVQSDNSIHNYQEVSTDMADSSSSSCCQGDHHLGDRGSCSESQTLPQLGLLPLLKALRIDGMSVEQLGHEFCGNSDRINGFPKLEKLCFLNMSEWKEWDGVGEADFPHLVELVIFNCPKLKRVPCLHSPLKKLKVERCAVESIPVPDSLKELDLLACDNLLAIPYPSSLQSLTLMYCQKLRSLPPVSLLENAESFWIEECDQLTASLSDGLIGSFQLTSSTFAK